MFHSSQVRTSSITTGVYSRLVNQRITSNSHPSIKPNPWVRSNGSRPVFSATVQRLPTATNLMTCHPVRSLVPNAKTEFRRFIDASKTDLLTQSIKRSTLKVYKSTDGKFDKFCLAQGTSLRRFTEMDVENYVVYLAKVHNLGCSAIKIHLSSLRMNRMKASLPCFYWNTYLGPNFQRPHAKEKDTYYSRTTARHL